MYNINVSCFPYGFPGVKQPPYERRAIERAVILELGGEPVPFASAEDLVIHKLSAGRARDLEDVATVIRRQRTRVDWAYLEKWAQEFASVPGRERMPEQVKRLRRDLASLH